MKTYSILIFVFSIAVGPFALAEDCYETAMSQSSLNSCAAKEFKEADNRLNAVYQEVRSKYSANELFLERLKKAQLAWIALRDADLEMMFPGEKKVLNYGSVYPMCLLIKKTELTNDRTKFLLQWLENPQEGDVCSGSAGTVVE